MDIKHPRRILAIGSADSGVLEIVKDLTGSLPPLNSTNSTAGVTHEWNVQTAYYSATVPIWIDEIPNAEAWKTEFLKPEAREVVEAVGAWVYCFRQAHVQNKHLNSELQEVLRAIQEVSEEHVGYSGDTVMLAVSVPSAKGMASTESVESARQHEELEDICLQYGFEYIDYSGKGMNEFREKTGFERLKEALEANEWSATTAADDGGEIDLNDLDIDNLSFGSDGDGFSRDEAEMTAELFGMKAALVGDEDYEHDLEDFAVPSDGRQANQVEDLDRLMGKLMAVKEQSADLPEAQRKRMAAKAVRELMGEGVEL